MKPVPPLRAESVEVYKNHSVAVYYKVTFVDANGNRFVSEDAKMLFDLTPTDETQTDETPNQN